MSTEVPEKETVREYNKSIDKQKIIINLKKIETIKRKIEEIKQKI